MVLHLQNFIHVAALICSLALTLCERINFYYLLVMAERVAVYIVFEISNSSIACGWMLVKKHSKRGSSGDQRTLVSYQDNKQITV